jgi:hypothetical protein
MQEEELARIAASHAKDEQAEFDKWKDLFSVDDGGTVEEQISAESQGLLAEFVEYIQQRKTVVLEELAAHFGLRTQDVINRIAGLESASSSRSPGLLTPRLPLSRAHARSCIRHTAAATGPSPTVLRACVTAACLRGPGRSELERPSWSVGGDGCAQ